MVCKALTDNNYRDNLMSEINIHIDLNPESEKDRFIREELHQFNIKHIGKDDHYSVFAYDSSSALIGGLLVYAGLSSIFITILWVKDSERGKGVGSMLLQAAESEGIRRKIPTSTLDTLSFQAKDFYLKNGYSQIGLIKEYIEGNDRLFFRKKLIL